MDTTQTTTHVSLCAGYGGIDLGLKRAIPTLRTIAFSEIEAFACANLVAKMEAGRLDAAPVWTNLKTFPWGAFRGRVDILSGGYPCQPFSAAGKRLGKDDPRHLWPWIADGIRAMQPEYCFFENVEGHISLGLREVIGELEAIGYATTWGVFSAAEVGAPHQRKRVFILAHNQRERVEELARQITISTEYPPLGTAVLLAESSGERSATGIPRSESGHEGHAGITDHGGHQDYWPSRPGEPQHGWEPPRVVTPFVRIANRHGRNEQWKLGHASQLLRDGGDDHPGSCAQGGAVPQSRDAGGQVCMADSERLVRQRGAMRIGRGTGCAEHAEGDAASPRGVGDAMWQAQPPLGGNADGSPGGLDYAELCVTCDNRTDELRLLGNGVVPAVATKAFTTLLKQLNTQIPCIVMT